MLNPASGRLRRSPDVIRLVREFAARQSPPAEITLTTHAGHATALAAEAAATGADVVVAVGGDGTMNECARALLGRPTVLALVPCGSGNGLARHLGIPLDPAAALALPATGRVRAIDAGLVNDEPFFCVAGTGFEAHISALFNRGPQRGFLRYLTASVREFRSYRPLHYRIAAEGASPCEYTALTLAFANAAQYGNEAHIAPAAEVDDGRLDLVAVPPISLLRAAPLVLRLFRRRLRPGRDVLTRRAAGFTVDAGRPMEFHLDGEVRPAAERLEVAVRPGCLRVVVPAGR